MPDDTAKINQLYHNLGHQLIDRGIWFARNAYKLKPKVFSRAEILAFLNRETGIPTNSISLADEKFYVETWDKWGAIIDFDLLNQQQYYSDFKDCDNFAIMYSARASLIYGLNSCAAAFGDIFDDKTEKYLFRHAYNLIITHKDGVLKLKGYEPQTDEDFDWQKNNGGVSERLGWRYKCDWILLF